MFRPRCVWHVFCVVFLLCTGVAPAAPTQAVAPAMSGTVVDETTGLPLSNATVTVAHGSARAVTDNAGHFRFTELAPGTYRLKIAHEGYQPAISDPVAVAAGQNARVTLSLQRANNGLKVIATTSVRASSSLVRSSTFYRSVPAEQLVQTGTERAADVLRTLPGINNGITGDTASPADDVNLNIRGIGTLETEATLDGHPIAFGMPGGYNYELSPMFGLRNINVTYGSGGTSLSGVDAIGGVIDFQTLDPTPDQRVEAMQGFGTFQNYTSALRATGTSGRWGYAAGWGTTHVDGPIANDLMYQPGAAYDQSATDPAVRNLGTYVADSTAVWRSGLAKAVYSFAPNSRLSFTTFSSSAWSNKTGNGDGDYLSYGPALTFGQHLLAAKPSSDTCPAGTFTATNANGTPNGAAPNGQPDGGIRCQTPQQYAAFNTGWQGAGPSWQSFNLFDNDLAYVGDSTHTTVRADLYASRYAQTFDRTFQLPFYTQPGDNANWRNRQVVETGTTLSDELHLNRNDVGFGFTWMNDAYSFTQRAKPLAVPFTNETGFFAREVYHPTARFYAYGNAWWKHASATNSWYLDPRLSLVYSLSPNDVVRFAAGKTTTQPSADMLGKSFSESIPTGAGGGSAITCSGLNSIGTAPSSVLKPETGVDQELAYGHRFSGDTQLQLSLYNVNVYNKLYSTLVPLSDVGSGFIDPAYLQQVEAIVASKCGAASANSLLGVTGTLNVARLQSQGFTLNGRVRLNRRLYVDYDWALTSTVFRDAPLTLLENNKTYIIGSQIPRLPLHTLDASIDQTVGAGFDLRYTLHTVSANNTKSLPPYNYSDFSITAPVGPGSFAIGVTNLFNQYAGIEGLRYQGVPLPLNQYATAKDYAPVIGADATEWFGLPYRQIFMSYTWRISRP